MADYQNEIRCEKQHSASVLDFLLNVFVHHGFAIVQRSPAGYELKGPGMTSSRQSPLLGVSRITCFDDNGLLQLRAEFDAIRKLRKLIILFLAGLALFFVSFFAILFRDREAYHYWLPLAPFLPWPFLP